MACHTAIRRSLRHSLDVTRMKLNHDRRYALGPCTSSKRWLHSLHVLLMKDK